MKKSISTQTTHDRKDLAKKILSCCLLGAPAGLTLQMLFWLWASWLRGDGQLHFVSGHLILMYGTELNAVTAQCVCSMLLGMLWASASLIFRDTDWSLLKQTVIHFLVCTVPSLGLAYGMHWMPRSLDGLLQYLRLFGSLYVVNWIAQYLSICKRIKQFNAQLGQLLEDEKREN